ncbi:LLM class flavin-dependent oxidoreductase [bacterium]|jgi:alkanesulfonate monooxygenase SsuD/methylene tetrahydromethanopterin reductase-like flavin-dependent oxidoreductase (luciferase family)|nr:LLM class flavin-dependent oxidoreductase [bacterium]MBT3849929.1 LLM class flavin-dependent oxidoreductase [bacterium]MBT4435826.1 LLM class flavin-dependent oxidoreductase [bacterium]
MKIGITTPIRGCSIKELRELASKSEQAGFYGIFSPEVPIYSAISNAQVMAEATKSIKVGTWVTNIYMREPIMCAAEAMTVQEISEGRMILGLGNSHKPVNDVFGIDMGDQYESMRDYVTKIKSYIDGSSEHYQKIPIKRDLPPFDIHITGLTERTAAMAGELADGMMPYLADLNHLKNLYKSAKLNAGDKKFEFTSGLPVFLSDNIDEAIKAARLGVGRQALRPSYKRVLTNSGFSEDVKRLESGIPPEEAISDNLLSQLCLFGKPAESRKLLEDQIKNGATMPILTPFAVGDQSPMDMLNQLVKLLD